MTIYHRIVTEVTVKPINESIFSEQSTVIRIDDEGAGEFIAIKQYTDAGEHIIKIDIGDWPLIKDTIDDMLDEIKSRESTEEVKQ